MKTITFPNDCVNTHKFRHIHKLHGPGAGCVNVGNSVRLKFNIDGTLDHDNDDSVDNPLAHRKHYKKNGYEDWGPFKRAGKPITFTFVQDGKTDQLHYVLTPMRAGTCDESK